MYNLFVSSNTDHWKGEPVTFEEGRCVNEYTIQPFIDRYGDLDEKAIVIIKSFPCIFMYENARKKKPKFGYITEVVKRYGQVKVSYEIIKLDKFLKRKQLEEYSFDFEIGGWELNRTHWAIKGVDLYQELSKLGITVPVKPDLSKPPLDISKHHFLASLSFSGENREYVEAVDNKLVNLLEYDNVFYDNRFKPQLARPQLDLLLQDIYRNRSMLIVVFLSGKYQSKKWCGLEWHAIRDIVSDREHHKIMYIKMDDENVDGVFNTDGYIDGRKHSAEEVANAIHGRVRLAASLEA